MKSWVPSLERIKRQQPSQGGKNSKKSLRKLQLKTSGILSEDILEASKFPILDKCRVVGTKDNHTNFQGLGIKNSPLTIPTLVGPGVRVWGIGYQISNLDRWGRNGWIGRLSRRLQQSVEAFSVVCENNFLLKKQYIQRKVMTWFFETYPKAANRREKNYI